MHSHAPHSVPARAAANRGHPVVPCSACLKLPSTLSDAIDISGTICASFWRTAPVAVRTTPGHTAKMTAATADAPTDVEKGTLNGNIDAGDELEVLQLSTCANMAALAFEAYLTPTVAREFTNDSNAGTTVQYINPGLVTDLFEGVMLVTVGKITPVVRPKQVRCSDLDSRQRLDLAQRRNVGTRVSVAARSA
jgi:hypothetical protein